MNAILAMVTIFSLSICGPEKNMLIEKLEFEKPSSSKIEHKTIFKKIPTKWVKITKKSN